jgi:hypothetical protein
MRLLTLLAFVALCAADLQAQAEWPKPNWEKVERVGCRRAGRAVASPIGAYQVRLVAGSRPDISNSKINNSQNKDSQNNDSGCRAYLVDRSGNETLLLEDSEVSIYQGTGEDVFGDGNPSLILEGYSGGEHCCYTYEIASLGEKPVILPPIKNQAPFFFFKDPASGQFRIMTSDGAFASFEGLCQACTPFPRVVLQMEAAGLRDVSPQFVEQYDSEIALARAKIAEGDIGKFLVADFQDARKVVLEIVFAYLYSGREGEAWRALDEMWPAGDRERIKKLILQTKARGILSTLRTRPALPYTH